ncbi:zinc finger HIT domain-containing protein 2 [Rhincodon typus]|uniref:zinc finger HIT domain-containing protein 2 n=1 Tax=Rhincodon typus TaxID=259920 RepID=UPI0009A471BE|nr:zinc finger HIT domain-containing protein 2 [Rhincodon typus]
MSLAGPVRQAEACGLCSGSGAAARYTCPRCNVPFCSLPCYRGSKHRVCAESFYREAVLGELREESRRVGGAEGRTGLRESLRRLRQTEAWELGELEPDDPQPGDTASRLWNSLSEEERHNFQRLLESGQAAAWIKEWRPWWERRPPAPVQELVPSGLEEDRRCEKINKAQPVVDVAGTGRENNSEMDAFTEQLATDRFWEHDDSIPAICSNIVPLLSLCSNPSPLIQYSVVNVLYAYAFSMKLVNGDLSGPMRDEFIEATVTVSEALKDSRVFVSTAEAVQAGVGAVRSSLYFSNPFEPVNTIKDTSVLLTGGNRALDGHYTLAAISHLHQTLGKAKRSRRKKDPDHYRARKKCAFLLSWVNEHRDKLMFLSLEVQNEYKNTFDSLVQVEEAKSNLEQAWGGKRPPEKKVLIEELTP